MFEFFFSAEFLGFLTVFGALSPLLSFARLYQMKEWRVDRLMEHTTREGWIPTLLGRTRALIIALYILTQTAVALFLMYSDSGFIGFRVSIHLQLFMPLWIALLAILSGIQIISRKQPTPVWTRKAQLITATSILLTVILTWALLHDLWLIALPLLVVFQSLIVLLAELLWRPLDRILKQRVFARARTLRSKLKNPIIIGIAGSVGKTTTKELIKTVLADLEPIATPAHVNTEMGVAQWLLSQKGPTEKEKPVIIVEMGAYRKGEIALLSSIVKPTIGVMTALGSDHLGLFGSEENIVDANAELIRALPPDGHLFLDGLNEKTSKLVDRSTCPATVTQSASDIHETAAGIAYNIRHTTYDIPLYGAHNVANALLAIDVAKYLGVPDARIQELLKGFKPIAHTFNVRDERGVLLLDDTYNSSPLSFRAALAWAKEQQKTPRTLITSGIMELGEDEALFMEEMGSLAKGTIDRVVFISKSGQAAFERGYGATELLSSSTQSVTGGTLVCIGRMPLSSIQRLLPQ